MKLWFPALDSSFRLLDDWHLSLERIQRNWKILGYLNSEAVGELPKINDFAPVVIPADSLLSISKYCISRGRESENRIQFKLEWCPLSPRRTKHHGIFEVYLGELSNADIEPVEDKTQRFVPPPGTVASPGEPMTFGEFDALTKNCRYSSGPHRPHLWLEFEAEGKQYLRYVPVQRDNQWDANAWQARFTAMDGLDKSTIRCYLNQNVLALNTPLVNVPAYWWLQNSSGHNWYRQPAHAKILPLTIRKCEWVKK